VSEIGGSDRIGFFSSGYDRKYATTGLRSGTDWIRLLDLRLHCILVSRIMAMEQMIERLLAKIAE
jgi:hypothetical protein